MGLFALTAFSVQQRTKEIGIRKVLGASVPEIFLLLSKKTTILIAMSNLLAWPTAYFFVNRWIEQFAYRIDLEIYYFLIGGVSSLLVGIFAISYQVIKTAVSNPLESLRYE